MAKRHERYMPEIFYGSRRAQPIVQIRDDSRINSVPAGLKDQMFHPIAVFRSGDKDFIDKVAAHNEREVLDGPKIAEIVPDGTTFWTVRGRGVLPAIQKSLHGNSQVSVS